MAVSRSSRYFGVPLATVVDGRPIRYFEARVVPIGARIPTRAVVNVRPDDRVDSIAARTLGDPVLYWQLCDKNDVLRPAELITPPGRTVEVGMPTQWRAS